MVENDAISATISETLGGQRFTISAKTNRDHSAVVLADDGSRDNLMWNAGPEDPEATSKFAEFSGSIEDGDVIEVLAHENRQNFDEQAKDDLLSDESRFETAGERIFIQNQNGEAVIIPEDEARED